MLCLLIVGRRMKKKGKKENRSGQGLFSQGPSQTCLAGYAGQDFCGCQVQLMADLRVSLRLLSAPNVMVVIILLGVIRITQVWLQHLKEVSEVMELRRSDSLPLPPFFSPLQSINVKLWGPKCSF
jgi:hypothetical protein